MSEIIRVEEDGVEFFTVATTGESGMSQSGLARLCGVDEGAVRKLLKLVRTSSSDEFLKPLWDMELTLRTSYREYKNAIILKDEVCVLVLECWRKVNNSLETSGKCW